MAKITQSEKFITFLIITLILIIASFSIIGSLTMLIIDKQRDISILQSMGAESTTIRKIFIFEGWLISILGAVIGVALGIAVCYAQEVFGFVKLGASGNFIGLILKTKTGKEYHCSLSLNDYTATIDFETACKYLQKILAK